MLPRRRRFRIGPGTVMAAAAVLAATAAVASLYTAGPAAVRFAERPLPQKPAVTRNAALFLDGAAGSAPSQATRGHAETWGAASSWSALVQPVWGLAARGPQIDRASLAGRESWFAGEPIRPAGHLAAPVEADLGDMAVPDGLKAGGVRLAAAAGWHFVSGNLPRGFPSGGHASGSSAGPAVFELQLASSSGGVANKRLGIALGSSMEAAPGSVAGAAAASTAGSAAGSASGSARVSGAVLSTDSGAGTASPSVPSVERADVAWTALADSSTPDARRSQVFDSVEGNLETPVSPVPEPAVWAMQALGLALFAGLMAFGRARRQATRS